MRMNSIRAKFAVLSTTNYSNPAEEEEIVDSQTVTLQPVIAQNAAGEPETENASFSKYTPSGEIRMNITNPNAFGFFEQGAEFYVDFTPADAPTEKRDAH